MPCSTAFVVRAASETIHLFSVCFTDRRIEPFASSAQPFICANLRRVPQLGREVAIALDALLRQLDVAALRRHRRQRHAQRIRAELVDQLQRVDGVALRLRHLLPLLVADERVDVDVLERHLAHEVDALHHHARDPEEDDVERRDQHRAGIELLQRRIGSRSGQPMRRERPQRGREPGVEDVFVR